MRLIDADALPRRVLKEKRFVFTTHDLLNNEYVVQTVYKDLAEFINEAPTIDAVPVVRCKDCEHWDISWEPENGNKGDHFCPMMDLCVPPDFFCKHGERRCDNE